MIIFGVWSTIVRDDTENTRNKCLKYKVVMIFYAYSPIVCDDKENSESKCSKYKVLMIFDICSSIVSDDEQCTKMKWLVLVVDLSPFVRLWDLGL